MAFPLVLGLLGALGGYGKGKLAARELQDERRAREEDLIFSQLRRSLLEKESARAQKAYEREEALRPLRERAELHGGFANYLRSGPGAVGEVEQAFGTEFQRIPGEPLGELK